MHMHCQGARRKDTSPDGLPWHRQAIRSLPSEPRFSAGRVPSRTVDPTPRPGCFDVPEAYDRSPNL